MTEKEVREVAALIAQRRRQGWDSQADRLWEMALERGADDAELAREVERRESGK